MALADSGPFPDPFIIGIHELFEFGVGHDAGRHISAHSSNFRSNASGHSVSVRIVRFLGKKNRDSTQSGGAKQARSIFLDVDSRETRSMGIVAFGGNPIEALTH